MTDKPLNLYQRINAIKQEKEVAFLNKDAQVQNYKAVTHDAVTAATRGAMAKHGVMLIPTLSRSEITESKTKSGASQRFYVGFYDIAFINCDNPEERLNITVEAHALDVGDKCPGKALSMATKYALLKILQIETGEHEESRANAMQYKLEQNELWEEQQLQKVEKLIKDTGSDIKAVFTKYGVKSLEELTITKRQDLLELLMKKQNNKRKPTHE